MAFPVVLAVPSATQPHLFNCRLRHTRSESARVALIPNRSKTRSDQLAERQAAEDNALLREVDDAVRQDTMAEAAKRYGIPVLTVAVAGLIGFGGYLLWHGNNEKSLETSSEELVKAMDTLAAGHVDSADKALAKLATDAPDGAKASAELLRAGIALQQGRKAEAVKLYEAVAANSSLSAPYRDLATIRAVAANFDAMKPDDVVARLKPLAVPGNAWFGSAGELVGAAYLKQGKNDLAGPLFASIAKDKDVPESTRSRARQLAGLLGVDAITDVESFVQTAGAEMAPAPAATAAPAQ